MKRAKSWCLAALAAATLTASAGAQSLFQRPIAPAPAAAPATPASDDEAPMAGHADGAPEGSADQASLFAVVAPKPRTWKKHDKLEIIINETSAQKSEQTLETKKSYDLKAELKQFPSLRRLLQDATIGNGIGSPGPSVDATGSTDYKGEGSGERKDRFTARISALVIDVKPNGMLVVEARESQQFDEDTKTMVLAGLCDPKDVTQQGTVLSSQVANLEIRVEHTGNVKEGSSKGWIPRVLDAIFGL